MLVLKASDFHVSKPPLFKYNDLLLCKGHVVSVKGRRWLKISGSVGRFLEESFGDLASHLQYSTSTKTHEK